MRGCGSWPHLLPGSLLPLCSADLSQVEITQPYLAKQADEISLQQADVVLVLGGEDGECQLRPGRVCLQWSYGRGKSFSDRSGAGL